MKLLTPHPIFEHFGLSAFVCLDFETTGLEPGDCEIIEAGAIKVENGEVSDTFHSLLSIDGELPETITNLTGIRREELEGQPPLSEVIPALASFIGEMPIVAHNLSFDLGFFKEMLIRLSEFTLLENLTLDSDKHWDILLLARIVLPLLHSHRLESLIDFFHITSDTQHRALEDVKAEIQIFDRLLAKSVEIPNEALAMLVTITRGKRKFYTRFFQLLHELRGKKYNLLVQNPLPDIRVEYPVSRNILPKCTIGKPYNKTEFVRRDVVTVFEEGGSLSSGLPDYEMRQEQIDMAEEVCRAYENEEFLLAEAGTGTGKSWAYLVPAVFWSYVNQDETSRTVVSTNTKNLQDQIFYKDLPFLHENLPVNFQAALLKGRGNYLCLNRWVKFLSQLDFATDQNIVENVLPLVVWANETGTGDIEEVSWFNPRRAAKLWRQIQSDGYYCLGQACRFKDQCFVNQIRRAARESDIVVINHSLLLSDLVSDNAVLSDYVNLIVDEAHNLENTAAQFLGQDWSYWSLRQLVLHFDASAVDNPNESDHLEKLLLRQSRLDNNTLKTIQLNIAQLRTEADHLKFANDEFFKSLYINLSRQKTGTTTYTRKIRYKSWHREYAALKDQTDELFQAFSLFRRELERLSSNLSEIPTKKFSKDDKDFFEENLIFIQGILSDGLRWEQILHYLLLDNQSEIVYWIEDLNRKEGFDIHFRSAPLNVAELLNEVLYSKLRTSVFTSATLSVKQEFDFFEQRMGFDLLPPERVNTKIVGSPFDYEDQMHVLVPKYMPNPNQIQFIDKTSRLIERSMAETRRATLVLFTSYKMLNQVFEQLKSMLHAGDLIAVAQGKSGSRINLLRMLSEGKAHALLGTHSFWEGVDLPGDALEILFITKLPFEVPSEPIVEARIEQMDQKGENSFYGYSLPNAVLKFRQGIGRLIRSRNDRGVVVLLDSRLVTSRYGSFFINSMPVTPTVVSNDEEFIKNLLNWFD